MIDVHFVFTEAEYLEAQELYMRERTRKFDRWLLPLKAIFGVCLVIFLGMTWRSIDWSNYPIWGCMILFALALFPKHLLRRRALRKRFLQEALHQIDVHLILDEQGYSMSAPGVGQGVSEWKSMSQWLEGKSVIMMKRGLVLQIVPKRALSDLQLEELRNLLITQIGPASR